MLPAAVADAVVVGTGHNGLVAANLLADAGWQVQVLEATAQPGGSVRTAELTAPGFGCDVFSAFYTLGVASPVLRRLDLERYGLEWVHAPLVVAHQHADGRCAVLSRDLAETAASLEGFAPGDGAAWERLFGRWRRLRGPVLSGLFSLFPPVRAGLGLAARLPPRGLLRFARFALLPVRGWPRRSSVGPAAGCCWAATPCTPTSARRPRAAASSAGRCAAWARRSAIRRSRAAPDSSRPRWSGGWSREAAGQGSGVLLVCPVRDVMPDSGMQA
jgi:phytoene dehydrogenase-like protein